MTRPRPAADLLVRDAVEPDLADVARIYAHHVLNGLASFEETPPDVAEHNRRYEAALAAGLPYLVAEMEGAVRGYAYALPYRARSAYRFAVEDSIYIDPEWTRRGIANALLSALIEGCANAGKRQIIAVIGDSANAASIGLHARHGFRIAGTLPSVGLKFGRWVDSVIMVRPLGNGDLSIPAE